MIEIWIENINLNVVYIYIFRENINIASRLHLNYKQLFWKICSYICVEVIWDLETTCKLHWVLYLHINILFWKMIFLTSELWQKHKSMICMYIKLVMEYLYLCYMGIHFDHANLSKYDDGSWTKHGISCFIWPMLSPHTLTYLFTYSFIHLFVCLFIARMSFSM